MANIAFNLIGHGETSSGATYPLSPIVVQVLNIKVLHEHLFKQHPAAISSEGAIFL